MKNNLQEELKISSNEYSNFVAAIITNGIILIIAFQEITFSSDNQLLLILCLIVIEACFILVVKKLFNTYTKKIFLIGESLHINKGKESYQIPVMKIRRIKLKHGNIGNSRPYRIEFLDDSNEIDSISFYVARWNKDFEKFISFIEENNPYAKIERYAMPWDN